MSTRDDRSERFNLRLALEELAMLHVLAKDAGLTASDILRQLLRAEWTRQHGKDDAREVVLGWSQQGKRKK
jgi:hypothetical protein